MFRGHIKVMNGNVEMKIRHKYFGNNILLPFKTLAQTNIYFKGCLIPSSSLRQESFM